MHKAQAYSSKNDGNVQEGTLPRSRNPTLARVLGICGRGRPCLEDLGRLLDG